MPDSVAQSQPAKMSASKARREISRSLKSAGQPFSADQLSSIYRRATRGDELVAPPEIMLLQQVIGNQAVGRLPVISRRSRPNEVGRKSRQAIAESEKATHTVELTGELDSDDAGGMVESAASPGATGQTTATPESPESGTVHLPDIQLPATPALIDQDGGSAGPPGGGGAPTASPPAPSAPPAAPAAPAAKPIVATLTYSPSVTQSGTFPPFGATNWSAFNMTHQTVATNPNNFTVTATVENPINFNVGSPKTDITSDSSPSLTSTNYAKAVSDLTPNMSSEGGKPPRTQFWASDLTVIHEQFHVTERKAFATTGVANAQTWLNGQTATSVDDVANLLRQVRGKVIATSESLMNPGKEERAYAAGAPAYKARAESIKTKGDAKQYPTPAPPAPPAPAPSAPAPPAPAPPAPPAPNPTK